MADIKNHFETDTFIERRSGGQNSYGNAYDPESLLTGAEIAAGLDYDCPRRYPSQAIYDKIVAGYWAPESIPMIAPRERRK